MPVRLRITFLFALLVFVILSIVCSGIYYFSYASRVARIQSRLTNRAITTARLLSQAELFDQQLVRRIDSLTTISLKNKTVQAFDYQDKTIYSYSDVAGDTLRIPPDVLDEARVQGNYFFISGDKEAVAYHYTDRNARIVIVTAAEDEEGKQYLDTLSQILIFSFLAGIIIAFTSGYFFSRSLLLPVRKIAGDVAEISAQNLARRIQTGTSRDEWYELSVTLNELLNRLQESFELQRRFISNASHELSTPLTSISSQLEVTLLRPREAEEYRKVMQSIYQDVRHMSQLTQTLLEFAKASGNAGGLEISPVRMDEIILALPAEAAKAGAGYTVVLRFGALPENEEQLLVFGNQALLQTAIRNIVVNACKYSDNHQAQVGLEADSEGVTITVQDTGSGIPEQELSHIFQPFYRAEGTRAAGGFGLGLSLADRFIKLHKGTISVRSGQGRGTTFTIRLPAAHSLSK